jgi:hypothetical protein
MLRAQCEQTPLSVAAENGHLGVVQLLVEIGAESGTKDKVRCAAPAATCSRDIAAAMAMAVPSARIHCCFVTSLSASFPLLISNQSRCLLCAARLRISPGRSRCCDARARCSAALTPPPLLFYPSATALRRCNARRIATRRCTWPRPMTTPRALGC